MRESIFSRVVRNEDSFTQLLCNFLIRFDQFRTQFFQQFLLLECSTADSITAEDIRTQVVLVECGRPDIVIETENVCIVIEVKTALDRATTNNQLLNPENKDEAAGYIRYLGQSTATERMLVYLIPQDWHCRSRFNNEQILYDQRNGAVKVRMLVWEQILDAIPKHREPLLDEFGKILSAKFSPLRTSPQEKLMIFSPDFLANYRAVRKLHLAMNAIAQRAKREDFKCERADNADDNGIYFRNDQSKSILFFGIWPEFNEAYSSRAPFCIAVKKLWVKDVPGLARAFANSCTQQKESFDGWDVCPFGPDNVDSAVEPEWLDGIWSALRSVLNSLHPL